MSNETSTARRPEDVARALETSLATREGREALKQAADATRREIARTVEAARMDPKVLQKRVTL